jgi:uncharacterized protein DUF4038/uncharacterized protein DUF5060
MFTSELIKTALVFLGFAVLAPRPGIADTQEKGMTERSVLSRDTDSAPHRGVYELALRASPPEVDPYLEVDFNVTFTRPDDSQVTVDGFYDGGISGADGVFFKARAYCDTIGRWSWRSVSTHPPLDGHSGTFDVTTSGLPGKLRVHPDDPYQLAYDSGEWFLHIGDTGYRYVTATEPEWQSYLGQAARAGFTKIRTWFCQDRSDVQILFGTDRTTLNLPYWQEIDRRLCYALEHYPRLQFQLIPYGEDTQEIIRYGEGDRLSHLIARYSQARFSALPNVHWCISNDREIVRNIELSGREVPWSTIDQMGRDMAAREPWATLLTNHQARFSGFDFADTPWSDLILLEDMDQVTGALILDYRQQTAAPIILDEDRYETYRQPAHSRYFFRRLLWASLLSGGHATYGGLRTFEPYDGELKGVQGYYDAVANGRLKRGADDFIHVHTFFTDSRLTLIGMKPDDALVGSEPHRCKCVHDDRTFLIYLANPTGDNPESDDEADAIPSVELHLPQGHCELCWFDPAEGNWTPAADATQKRAADATQKRVAHATQGQSVFTAPGPGDWVVLLRVEPR